MMIVVGVGNCSENSRLSRLAKDWGKRMGFEKVALVTADTLPGDVWAQSLLVPDTHIVFIVLLSEKGYVKRNIAPKLIKADQEDSIVHEMVHHRFGLDNDSEAQVVEATRVLLGVRHGK